MPVASHRYRFKNKNEYRQITSTLLGLLVTSAGWLEFKMKIICGYFVIAFVVVLTVDRQRAALSCTSIINQGDYQWILDAFYFFEKRETGCSIVIIKLTKRTRGSWWISSDLAIRTLMGVVPVHSADTVNPFPRWILRRSLHVEKSRTLLLWDDSSMEMGISWSLEV